MNKQIDKITARILKTEPSGARCMVAIAGPPGSGKSTLAAAVADRLNKKGRISRHIPMDGFHLDNEVLEHRGLLHRKGAPESFDAEGFVHAMRRLASEPEVVLPDFDRKRDVAIAGRIVVDDKVEIAVVDGNYLIFDAAPWSELDEIWDLSVFLDVQLDVLRGRLVERWLEHGLSEPEATERTEGNDMKNAALISGRRRPATMTIRADGSIYGTTQYPTNPIGSPL